MKADSVSAGIKRSARSVVSPPAAVSLVLLLLPSLALAGKPEGLAVRDTKVPNQHSFEYKPDPAKGAIGGLLGYPEGIPPYRAVILVHGRGGSAPKMMGNYGQVFLDKGYAVIVPELPFPSNMAEEASDPTETMRRLSACVDILVGDARMDANNIFMFGLADGAVSAVAFCEQNDKIKAAALCGGEPRPESSSMKGVAKLTAPILIIHGANDQSVPVENAKRFKDALDKAGKSAELKVFEGRGAELPMIKKAEVFDLIVAFFGKYAR